MNEAFNAWWDRPDDGSGHPYEAGSPAYWAWSGWKAGAAQAEQELAELGASYQRVLAQREELHRQREGLRLPPCAAHGGE